MTICEVRIFQQVCINNMDVKRIWGIRSDGRRGEMIDER